jgi:hypothetical protein
VVGYARDTEGTPPRGGGVRGGVMERNATRTIPGLNSRGMNCYGALPIGSRQYSGGLRLPLFTYLRITTATAAYAVRRIFTVVIFFVRGLSSRRTMAIANYVEQLIKLSEGKNSLYVPRIVVKKA